MKLGFSFSGIGYGEGGRTGSRRDFCHCWNNLYTMLVQPFIDQGHEAKIYFSTYKIGDEEVEKEFFETVKPKAVYYSEFAGSTPFTCKGAACNAFMHEDLDAVIFTRSDLHYSKVIANEKIDFNKFNFLFPEKDWFNTPYKFSCDNLYIFPHHMTPHVHRALNETYGWPRGESMPDTHALMVKLSQYVPESEIRFISETEELSDVNTFFTCCRSGLPNRGCMHPEVRERYNQEGWSFHQ